MNVLQLFQPNDLVKIVRPDPIHGWCGIRRKKIEGFTALLLAEDVQSTYHDRSTFIVKMRHPDSASKISVRTWSPSLPTTMFEKIGHAADGKLPATY